MKTGRVQIVVDDDEQLLAAKRAIKNRYVLAMLIYMGDRRPDWLERDALMFLRVLGTWGPQ